MKELPGYAQARKILEKNQTARAKYLKQLESFVDGTQYEGLPDWFSDKKPLWERAPCIVYPIVRMAIDSNGDLLLGEGRFPMVAVEGLTGEEADNFEKGVTRVLQQARLRAAAREVWFTAQSCGSACAVFGIRNNRLFVDTVLARWCEPVLAVDGSVESLVIQYPYLTLEKVENEDRVVCKLYRREIDAQHDVTFLPANAREDGKQPAWRPDPDRTITHGLGFCPVVWYAHMRGCSVVNDYDGHAIHEHLTDEIRALDFALSQRHRAALYAGDPQWTEIGVEPGFNPTGTGRKAEAIATLTGRPGDMPTGAWVSEPAGGASKARRKSPGVVWQYGGKAPETKVELHTLPGDALLAIDNHARDLRSKLAEALGVVFLDPESLPNESRISGLALKSFRSRQLDRVDYYRSDVGDHFLMPALGMLLRIALQAGLDIDGLDVIRTRASKPSWSWHAPPIDFIWGDYFTPSGEEEELIIRGATEALTAGLATKRVLVEKLRSIFGIKDIDSFMMELEAEQAERQKQETDKLVAQTAAKASAQPKPPQ